MLTIDVYNDQLSSFLDEYRLRVRDHTPVLHAIGQGLENRISARFETQTDPNGHPWAKWAPSTIKYYPDDGNQRILDRYGDMLATLNHQVEASDSSVSVGFNVPYATFHEFGTTHMPRRGLLSTDPEEGALSQGDVEYVLDVLQAAFSP